MDNRGKNSKTHGMWGTRFHTIWIGMKQRCTNPKMNNYKNYGGRGIKVIWKSFEEFRDDMYEDYEKHLTEFGKKQTTIERIDNDGNYCPENCCWATRKEQCRNTR